MQNRIKNNGDLKALAEKGKLKKQAKQIRVKEKLGQEDFHYDA